MMGAKLSEYHTGFRAFSRELLEALPLEANSDDFVFDNQVLAQAALVGARIGEISCPTRYFKEASSINFRRSSIYGLGVLRTSILFRMAKWGICHSPIFAFRPNQIGKKKRSAGRIRSPAMKPARAVWLGLLFAICVARLWLMALPSSFWVDETVTAFVVERPHDPSLAVAPQVPASIYYWLPRMAVRLGGASEVVYRIPSRAGHAGGHLDCGAAGGAADPSASRMVCGLCLPGSEGHRLFCGGCAAVRAGDADRRGRGLVSGELARWGALAGRVGVYRSARRWSGAFTWSIGRSTWCWRCMP